MTDLHPRAAELLRTLDLRPHPEGGFYREVFRSAAAVRPEDGRPERSALTLIYFLLVDGAVSRWHRVTSDEGWCWLEGAPLELHRMDGGFGTLRRDVLGPVGGDGVEPVRVVPAGAWQAARTTGAYTLVSCAVGPGFDFADFAMLSDDVEASALVRERHPEAAGLV